MGCSIRLWFIVAQVDDGGVSEWRIDNCLRSVGGMGIGKFPRISTQFSGRA